MPPTASQSTGRAKGLANLRPWQPGQSGNPSGKPKGLARQARDLIGSDPKRILSVLLSIAEDESAKESDRIAAARELLDRGYGKAPAYAPVEGSDPLEVGDVDRAVAATLDDLAARRQTPAAGRGEAPPVEATG